MGDYELLKLGLQHDNLTPSPEGDGLLRLNSDITVYRSKLLLHWDGTYRAGRFDLYRSNTNARCRMPRNGGLRLVARIQATTAHRRRNQYQQFGNAYQRLSEDALTLPLFIVVCPLEYLDTNVRVHTRRNS